MTNSSQPDVRGLYTPAQLAELLAVPVAAIRRWNRRGYLQAECEVSRVAYFAAGEVHVARLLAELLTAGCSLAAIDSRLAKLTRLVPDVDDPLHELPLVVEGRKILVRRGYELAEPGGQLLIDFDATDDPHGQPAAISIATISSSSQPSAGELRELAANLEATDQRGQAIEVLRSVAISGAATADDHFALAELLYRAGELPAARERYFVALEADEEFVEARVNLGCLLNELGETELAEAAFRGALEHHPRYTDAHYHLAGLLESAGRIEDARIHWQAFLEQAPDSPWADEAESRMRGG